MEQLERLGLNRNEAKIYLVLLDLGEAQAGEISKKTQINRTIVRYDGFNSCPFFWHLEKPANTFMEKPYP